jgi:hypothetical protein
VAKRVWKFPPFTSLYIVTGTDKYPVAIIIEDGFFDSMFIVIESPVIICMHLSVILQFERKISSACEFIVIIVINQRFASAYF